MHLHCSRWLHCEGDDEWMIITVKCSEKKLSVFPRKCYFDFVIRSMMHPYKNNWKPHDSLALSLFLFRAYYILECEYTWNTPVCVYAYPASRRYTTKLHRYQKHLHQCTETLHCSIAQQLSWCAVCCSDCSVFERAHRELKEIKGIINLSTIAVPRCMSVFST